MAQKDAWRAYYELALGFTETSRKKALKIIKDVAGKSNVSADQLQELVNTAIANREAMSRMVKVELDRALGRVGLATMEEVDELTKRVRDLERELHVTRSGTSAATEGSPTAAATKVAKKTAAKKTVAKKTVAKAEPRAARKTVAKKTVAKKTVAKKTVAKKAATRAEPGASEPAHTVPAEPAPAATAAAKKAPARKAAAKKAPAKTTAVRRTPAKKTTKTAATSPESAS